MIVLAGLLGTGHAGVPSPIPDPTQADIQHLRQLTRAENQALVDGDTNQLKTLLAADFTAITIDGQNLSAKQLIAALGSGDLDVWSIRIEELSPADPIEVHLDGNNATITYQSDIEVGSHPIRYRHDCTGADYHRLLRTRHTDIWTGFDGTWQHLHAQTTTTALTTRPGAR